MSQAGYPIRGAKVVVLGLTFKENCPDLRNSKVIDVIQELRTYGVDVYVHDPIAAAGEARHEYGIELVEWDLLPRAAAIVGAVAHDEYRKRPLADYLSRLEPRGVVMDVKSMFDTAALRAEGVQTWRL
jgi:UDP-N-acetyl-D-galactosamine dehydrogenase